MCFCKKKDEPVHCKDCIYYDWEVDEPPWITEFKECKLDRRVGFYHFRDENDTCPLGVRRKTRDASNP